MCSVTPVHRQMYYASSIQTHWLAWACRSGSGDLLASGSVPKPHRGSSLRKASGCWVSLAWLSAGSWPLSWHLSTHCWCTLHRNCLHFWVVQMALAFVSSKVTPSRSLWTRGAAWALEGLLYQDDCQVYAAIACWRSQQHLKTNHWGCHSRGSWPALQECDHESLFDLCHCKVASQTCTHRL